MSNLLETDFSNPAEAKHYLQTLHEKYWIELKKANELPKAFWESYSAFANTEGGYIILGIVEKEPLNEIVGVGNLQKILSDFWNQLSNQNKVSHSTVSNEDVFTVSIEGVDIIVIHVNAAPESQKPVYLNNNTEFAFLRTGDGDRRATLDELDAMRRNANPITDTLIANHFTMEDLDGNSVLIFKEMISNRYPAKKYLEMSTEAFLTEIGGCSIDRISKELRIRRGTVLFLGKVNSIRELFPHYHLDYFNHRGSNPRWSDRVTDDEPGSLEMNLFNFYRIVNEKLKFLIETDFQLDSGKLRIPEANFDETLRECLANCLAHADYAQGIPSTKIDIYDGWFAFKNPGKMLVSEQQFIAGGESRIRNEIIMKFFRLLGVSDRQGFGGPLIFKSAQKNDYRKPEITTNIEFTELKVWNIDLVDSYPELSLLEKTIFQFIIKHTDPIAFKELNAISNETDYKKRKAISKLIEKNMIQQVGNGPTTRYSVKSDSLERITQIQIDLERMKSNL